MLYPELFKSLERVRWNMDTDIPWDTFDASLLTDEQATTIKMNAITEWAALPATVAISACWRALQHWQNCGRENRCGRSQG